MYGFSLERDTRLQIDPLRTQELELIIRTVLIILNSPQALHDLRVVKLETSLGTGANSTVKLFDVTSLEIPLKFMLLIILYNLDQKPSENIMTIINQKHQSTTETWDSFKRCASRIQTILPKSSYLSYFILIQKMKTK